MQQSINFTSREIQELYFVKADELSFLFVKSKLFFHIFPKKKRSAENKTISFETY